MRIMRDCQTCGIAFQAYNAQKFCSNNCRSSVIQNLNLRNKGGICECCGNSFEGRKRRFCTSCRPSKKQKSDLYNSGGVCENCNCSFEGRRRRFCSYDCLVKKNLREGVSTRRLMHVNKICRYCALEFTTGDPQKKYCSQKCRRRTEGKAKTARRRAIRLGFESERFSVIQIFERDNWICQICTRPTLRATGKDDDHKKPRAPQLDHIIPLSKGGGHTPNNVQLLCRECNMKKRNTLAGKTKISGEIVFREAMRQYKKVNGPSCWMVF